MRTEVDILENQTEPNKASNQQKVDINILLNRVRNEQKKESSAKRSNTHPKQSRKTTHE